VATDAGDRRSRRDLAPAPTPGRTAVRCTFGLLGFVLIGYLASLLLRHEGQTWIWLDGWVVGGVELVASALCIARGLLRRPGRETALVLGAALLAWTLGDLVLTIESLGGATPPTPSLADLFYLAFYPLAYVAVVFFMRGEVRRMASPNWLDGAIAGLGAGAVCAAFAFHAIVSSTGRSALATATALAYPIGDVVLLGLVAAGFAVLSGRRKTPWILLAVGMALNVVGDTANLFQNSFGATRFGTVSNAIAWPAAIVVMASAVWVRPRPSNPLAPARPAGFVLPNLAAVSALVILCVGSLHSLSRVAVALATAALAAVGVRLALSVREMKALSQERHRQSVTDDLTGLHNRRYLFRVLDAFFAECGALDTPERNLAFLFVDLNHFKEINDTFGHPAGDELLRQLGARLSCALRDTDLLVRLGGDEFAVVLMDSDAQYAALVADRLTASLADPFSLDVVTANVSASIGIALAPADASDSAGLVWCADVAMYRAKLGNTSSASYEQELDDDGDQMRLVEELRASIDNGDLVLHYQPQLDLRSGEIQAVEALLRWAHPRLGLLAPVKFLPVAEEAGLMSAITNWVVAEATAQCAAWREGGRALTVSVNVSPTNLLEPGFVDMVRDRLEAHHLPAGALVVEITETLVISDFETARHVIEELRDIGLVVSIDDFGAGVTSLAYLSSLAVGELKLDRSFIANLEGRDSDRDLDLVRSTIELGHAMGLRIVAEGIENAETLALLGELGCDFAQGYCIGRPKPAGELALRPELATTGSPS